MHMIKVETLEATSTESLWVLKNQDPTGARTQDLLIASQTLLPLSYWVSGGRGVQDWCLYPKAELSPHQRLSIHNLYATHDKHAKL